ncbi:MAG: hypothetical protein KC619_30705 [Myxococcales bacterium]|nr:hypothetical protein [Myxococcales bacterium]
MRPLLLALLLASVAGCANGSGPMTRGGDAGPRYDGGSLVCGAQGLACCGAGFCNDGLACIAGVCTGSSCGIEGMACCEVGDPCGPGLACFGGSCLPELFDAGTGSGCGMRGGGCCATTPSCGVGLTCVADVCRDSTSCGAVGEGCCSGDVCDVGNLCVDGTCRMEVPVPSCRPLGGTCSTNADCCEGTCASGICSNTTTPPPPPGDPCGDAFSCYDCTLMADCGFCDGACIYVSDPSSVPCVSFQWSILDCF